MKKTNKIVLGVLLATFIGVGAYSSVNHKTTNESLRDGEYHIILNFSR